MVAYFLASAVADRDFSWVHATSEKITSPSMAALIGRVASDPSGLTASRIEQILAVVHDLEVLQDVSDLTALLAPA